MARQPRGCDVDGCERRHYALGWCSLHWRRIRENGSPHRDRDHATTQRGELPRDVLVRLRRDVGVPDDGPTRDDIARWLKQEQETTH